MATQRKTKQLEFKDSAKNIWWAGLGALATAEAEGGKLFKTLIGKGKKYESSLRAPVDRATGKVRGTVKTVSTRANKTLKRVETAFDEQVASALQRIGVASRKEISELSRKVERLTKMLEGRKTTTRKRATTKRKTTRRTARA